MPRQRLHLTTDIGKDAAGTVFKHLMELEDFKKKLQEKLNKEMNDYVRTKNIKIAAEVERIRKDQNIEAEDMTDPKFFFGDWEKHRIVFFEFGANEPPQEDKAP